MDFLSRPIHPHNKTIYGQTFVKPGKNKNDQMSAHFTHTTGPPLNQLLGPGANFFFFSFAQLSVRNSVHVFGVELSVPRSLLALILQLNMIAPP